MSGISVAIVDDDPCVLWSLGQWLEKSPGLVLDGSYSTGEAALRHIPRRRPDVVLMDVTLPRMNGIECTRRLLQGNSRSAILMLTVHEEQEVILGALRAGAAGYLSKRENPAKIISAIYDLALGRMPLSQTVTTAIVDSIRGQGADLRTERLTVKERQIGSFLADGLSYREIASRLEVKYETVHTHVRHLYRKLGVRSRSALVAHFYRFRAQPMAPLRWRVDSARASSVPFGRPIS